MHFKNSFLYWDCKSIQYDSTACNLIEDKLSWTVLKRLIQELSKRMCNWKVATQNTLLTIFCLTKHKVIGQKIAIVSTSGQFHQHKCICANNLAPKKFRPKT
jgi:hypothetical protein